nr:histidine phosphatase family protein [Microbacterium esteraromaticum]
MVRHGESLLNAAGRMQGWADAPLTSRGIALALARGRMLAAAGIGFDAAWSADGIRHRETARHLLAGAGAGVVAREDSRWREMCFGALEGARTRRFGRLIVAHGELRPALEELAERDPSAEHPDAVVQRSRAALAAAAQSGEEVLVVTSGITKLLLLDALEADLSHLDAGPPHLSLSTVTLEKRGGAWRVDRAVRDTL